MECEDVHTTCTNPKGNAAQLVSLARKLLDSLGKDYTTHRQHSSITVTTTTFVPLDTRTPLLKHLMHTGILKNSSQLTYLVLNVQPLHVRKVDEQNFTLRNNMLLAVIAIIIKNVCIVYLEYNCKYVTGHHIYCIFCSDISFGVRLLSESDHWFDCLKRMLAPGLPIPSREVLNVIIFLTFELLLSRTELYEDEVESWILIGDTSCQHPSIHCKRYDTFCFVFSSLPLSL